MSAYSPIGRHVRQQREGIVHQMGLAFPRVLPQKIIDHALAEGSTVSGGGAAAHPRLSTNAADSNRESIPSPDYT